MNKTMNRWVYLMIGVVVMFFAGQIYAWSVISGPMVGYNGWTDSTLTWVSTIVMCAFCLGGFFGGLLQKKINVKIIFFISAVLFILGFLITAKASVFFMVLAGFGLLAGLASGLSYNTSMSIVSKWFPDKQGTVSGIMLMAFGIGSFVVGKIYTSFITKGTPWQTCLIVLGIVCAVVMLVGGIILAKPSDEQAAKFAEGTAVKNMVPYEELTTGQMLKRASFWLMFVWAIFTSVAGMAVIFLGRPIAVASVPSLADAPGTVATVVGLISVCNAVSRIFFGRLFDKAGYKITLVLCCVLFVIAMGVLLAALSTGSIVVLFIAYIVTGLAYGGVTPTQSAFVNKFFGSRYYPVNFSIMVMNLLIASFGTKLADAVNNAFGSYRVVIFGIIGLSVISIILALLIKKPKMAENTQKTA